METNIPQMYDMNLEAYIIMSVRVFGCRAAKLAGNVVTNKQTTDKQLYASKH